MGKLCKKYDAVYDEEGNWLEEKCGNPNCFYCKNRPEKHAEDCECENK